MSFEVIEGGGLDSLLWSEMTEEQKEERQKIDWYEAEPNDGSIESIFRFTAISKAAVITTVETLEAFRKAMEEDAARAGIRSEWPHIDADFLLRQLKTRKKADAGEL